MVNREVYKRVKELFESNFTQVPDEKEKLLSYIAQIDIRCFIAISADYASGSGFEHVMIYTRSLWENLSDEDWKVIRQKTYHKEVAEKNLKRVGKYISLD